MISLNIKYLACVLGLVSAAAFAQVTPAGNVIFVNGEASIINASGAARAAAKGMAIALGETLATGKAGALHVRMADGGFVAMRPDTRITVRDFAWNGKEDGSEKSVLALLSGGFRTITGVIGRRNKDNYQVITNTATIGIRGTDHEPHYIAPAAPGEAQQGEPGTYNKVNVGATFIRNASGVLELGPNEAGFASARPGVAPQRLARLPAFMRNAPVPLNLPDRESSSDDGTSRRHAFLERLGDWAEGDDERKRIARGLLRFAAAVANSGLDLGVPVREVFSVAPAGTVMVGGINAPGISDNGGMLVTADNNNLILLGPNNRPLFLAVAGDGFRYSRGVAPLVDSGDANINGTGVTWGIYAGGDSFNSGSTLSPRFFHFMLANNVTTLTQLQLPGAAAFATVAGFTKPINEAGQVGGNVLLNVGLQFGAVPRVTSYNLGVMDAAGRNWSAVLSTGFQSLVNFAPGSGAGNNLNVNCAACGGAGTGKAAGYVIGGANRDALLSSYGLNVGTAAVTGSVVVK